MSTGTINQYVDYEQGGDSGANDPSSIQPIVNGEDVDAAADPAVGDGVSNRAAQNLRGRSEVVRDLLEDTLYLRDADRGGLLMGGPGLVSWGGALSDAGTGILALSDNIYILPALTPGAAQTPPVAPVASKLGLLTLLRSNSTAGLTVQSLRRSYARGDKISVQVVSGGSPGTCTATLAADIPQRSIVVVANTATLSQVISALNGLFPTDVDDASQLVQATLAAGAAGTDTLLAPQSKQFVAGNYDAEAHTVTPTNLATFFATSANRLDEGDALCIQYATMNDPLPGPPLGGRRQSIPENSNTVIPAGSFFNSRVHPERLVNAIPIGKVIVGRFMFMTGPQLPKGAVNVDLGGLSAASVSWPGGAAWADGTTNPATDLGTEVSKIITDLASEASSSGADKIGTKSQAFSFGTLAAQPLAARLLGLDAAKANLGTPNTFARKQTINTSGDAEAAVVAATAPSTDYRLFAELSANTTLVRVYQSAVGGFLITSNAVWIPGTLHWHQDNPTISSYALQLDFASFKLKSKGAGLADWVDGAWITNTTEAAGLLTSVTGVFNGLLSGDRVRAMSAADPGTGNVGGLIGKFGFVQTDRTSSRTLVWQMSIGSAQNFRLYRAGAGGTEAFELVNNASWNGTVWTYDVFPTTSFGPVGATAWKIAFLSRTQALSAATSPAITFSEKINVVANWADNAWDLAGGLDFGDLLPNFTINANLITPLALVKAWCDYSYNGSAFNINSAYNVSAVGDAFNSIFFTFNTPFLTTSMAPHMSVFNNPTPSGFTNPPIAVPNGVLTSQVSFGIYDGATLRDMTGRAHRGFLTVSGLQ